VRVCVQRVARATVTVNGSIAGQIGQGLLILIGVGKSDTTHEADWVAEKCAGLRVFTNSEGKMDLSVLDVKGSVLVVPQFTLYGDVHKGKRPNFTNAAGPEMGKELYEHFCEQVCKVHGLVVQTGVFGAHMDVELVNDGPVTIWIEKEAEGS